jgi:hypothetical protein
MVVYGTSREVSGGDIYYLQAKVLKREQVRTAEQALCDSDSDDPREGMSTSRAVMRAVFG